VGILSLRIKIWHCVQIRDLREGDQEKEAEEAVHGREELHRREDNLQIKVYNMTGMNQRVVFIVVDLDILLKIVIRRKVMSLGINLEHIQVIMQKKCQIMISDYLLLVIILMNSQILNHRILGFLCLTLLYLLKWMILMPGLWIPEHQYI
jgi:hypothetical protein